jgi:hypothetical protein
MNRFLGRAISYGGIGGRAQVDEKGLVRLTGRVAADRNRNCSRNVAALIVTTPERVTQSPAPGPQLFGT